MAEKPIYQEIFAFPRDEFFKHLDNENNDRILFSGRYGVGKTTFIKHFFEESEHKNKYNCFHLYPVNYSILDNADVLSYIKFDILYELINEKYSHAITQLSPEIKDYRLATLRYALANYPKLISLLVLAIPKLGKQYHKLIEEWNKVKEDFEKFKEEEKGEEYNAVINFIDDFQQEGDLYESNFITEIIVNTLENLKGTEDNKKENVLILDDLDRIDPQHIFRLFNVFAAHFDERYKGIERKNKFNFDKVIFVCNVDNIRSIFHHYYGQEANFNGYIDKFYDEDIFRFDNRKNLDKIVAAIVRHNMIQITPKLLESQRLMETIKDVIENILLDLINSNNINLRKFLKTRLNIKLATLNHSNLRPGNFHLFYYLPVIQALLIYFDDTNSLKNTLRKTKVRDGYIDDGKYHYEDLILLSCMNKHLFLETFSENSSEDRTNGTYEYIVNAEVVAKYKIIYYRNFENRGITYYANIQEGTKKYDFYKMLIQAIENLEELKYF